MLYIYATFIEAESEVLREIDSRVLGAFSKRRFIEDKDMTKNAEHYISFDCSVISLKKAQHELHIPYNIVNLVINIDSYQLTSKNL